MINRDLPQPAYQQLAAILRAEITSGRLAGKLPGERYLAQQYDCAVNTVRKAMTLLRDEGLVESVHGLGSFAIRPGR